MNLNQKIIQGRTVLLRRFYQKQNEKIDSIVTVEKWSTARKAGFRFLCIYLMIYCLPFPLDGMGHPKFLVDLYFRLLDSLITGIGQRVLDLPVKVAYPGFDKVDDSYYGISFIIVNLAISVIGTVLWTLLDRRSENNRRLNQWLQLYLRFFLASYLIGYGLIKIFPSQFQEVTASRLVMEVGEQTPMMLAWNFMGYSVVYAGISGAVEVIAGLLLFFRRTTTLGALLATISFTFVVMLDYCFNVPVKLLASHLFLISLVVLLNDSRRLIAYFLLNKPVESIHHQPFFNRQRWQSAFTLLQVLVAVLLIYGCMERALHDARLWGRYVKKVPYYGIYKTERFTRNGEVIPAIDGDSSRWKMLVIDGGS